LAALALRTMSIAAAVVGNGGVTARRVRAARNMPAEGRRPAAFDGVHHLHLCVTEVALIGMTPSRAVIAEDLRDLHGWAAHVYRRLLRRVLLGGERRELIERAQHIAQNLARDVGVAGRRVEFGMAESHLDYADIDTLLQKVGGERVPQRMRRHPLLDADRIRRSANDPMELAC